MGADFFILKKGEIVMREVIEKGMVVCVRFKTLKEARDYQKPLDSDPIYMLDDPDRKHPGRTFVFDTWEELREYIYDKQHQEEFTFTYEILERQMINRHHKHNITVRAFTADEARIEAEKQFKIIKDNFYKRSK